MMSKLVVLVVEDEPLLRMDAADFIEDAGFEVVEAVHAGEAIDILKARHDIAVVFTDIEMPGSMDGMKLAHAVRLGWPPILIVVASGRVMPREGDLPENVHYIRKPYRPADVLAAFRATV
jgi:CheY-like chemotaxis protein